ncbi:DNA repair protein RadA [Ammonifex degensii KC4]|uniref:DNA repair protein RadA n=1 Tax=Ammonifex degensii (strain DSM 10501 / KC4) TaxID=429009 RepID=C9RBC2_AMMDK|nr:DNA repair protein RadA [Ammonifex degensii]ACX51549.1 DNA repair protein RadA [Ammonifex degensii KC4]
MAKERFQCLICGYQSTRWLGRCPECGSWDSFSAGTAKDSGKELAAVYPLQEIEGEEERLQVGMEEFDRVLGGGIVPGSLILVGGDPGIGKSTLLLQVASQLGRYGQVLYVSGEESVRQVASRARRLRLEASSLLLAAATDVEVIKEQVERLRPCALVVDSIQTLVHPRVQAIPGSVAQVRECIGVLQQLAKGLNLPIMVIGHVTKEGILAGPRLLEHIVDVVLYLEGDRYQSYRLLRGVKNRYGATHEIGVFTMTERGMVPVVNPSALFLAGSQADNSVGAAVVPTLEGTRPLLVEIQALVSTSYYSLPRRMTTGLDFNRTLLLLAVLEKRLGLRLSSCDVYLNVVGGMKLIDPGADLAAALAVVSSYRELPFPRDVVVVGEVGLTGEVRPVRLLELRLKEAAKLGFSRAVVGRSSCCRSLPEKFTLIPVASLGEAIEVLWQR